MSRTEDSNPKTLLLVLHLAASLATDYEVTVHFQQDHCSVHL